MLLDLLARNPMVVIVLVLALGGLFGQIPFGPVRFGAAGALFMGLVVGGLDPRFGQGLGLAKALGVVLFCYTVGLVAGSTFRSDLRRQWSLMLAGVAGLAAMAAGTAVLGHALGLTSEHLAGGYAGVLTSPAIDAAISATDGSTDTLVGYALAYPTGVIVGMVLVAALVGRSWPGRRDNAPLAQAGITGVSARVERPSLLADVPGWSAQRVKMSYLQRDATTRVITGADVLQPGDHVLVVGTPADVDRAIAHLGHTSTRELTHQRREVDFRRFLVSNPALVGRTVGELGVEGHLHGIITRVRRGDLDMLARDDLVLQPGDRVLAVVPREHLDEAGSFFGDSERHVSQVDAMTMGLGMLLGLVAGLVSLPLGEHVRFALGAAAGPLVVGMVLGGLHRTGPLRWDLPHAANAVIRQLGLMVFLACVGLASGPALWSAALTRTGAAVVLTTAASLVLGAAVLVAGARLAGLSAQRTAGGLAGFIGQPAILGYAVSRRNDERIESAYGALFALGTVAKILLVQLIALA